MSSSYSQTAARLGFVEIPNESDDININKNIPKDYRYKKTDTTTTTGINYDGNNKNLKEFEKYKLSSEYNKNKYSRDSQYHNYNNFTTRTFTDNVSEIFFSNAYDPSKDKNIINEIRPEKRKVYTNKYNQKVLLNESVDGGHKENNDRIIDFKYNSYFNSMNKIKNIPPQDNLNTEDTENEDKNNTEKKTSSNEPEYEMYNKNSTVSNYNDINKDGIFQRNNNPYTDKYKMISNSQTDNNNNMSSIEKLNKNINNNIPNENLDTKRLFYSTENSSYNHGNYSLMENNDKYKNNDEYNNYLLSNKYVNDSNKELNSTPRTINKEKKNEKKVTFYTPGADIENQLKNMKINETNNEYAKTFQDIENEKRKLYNDFVNNRKNPYDVNKWSQEYDKLNTLEKLNNYTSKRYNMSFDNNNESKSNNENGNFNSYNNEINNNHNSENDYNTQNNNTISKINTTPLKSSFEKNQSKDNSSDVGPYIHSYIKNNPNPNLYDMRYYQRLNSSKRVQELLGGLNKELER
ncbi:hypothetical protein PIROE2DRAFT_7671 [Piromyces sp. E2]|nr:hypothetical protein PIROE2DRAFT_7671 [Piromyces sp. E2]|eukprot:OUM65370.1 hypothetical protein PIROE2DRAFT_7671 [Piromyces sp. E2]